MAAPANATLLGEGVSEEPGQTENAEQDTVAEAWRKCNLLTFGMPC